MNIEQIKHEISKIIEDRIIVKDKRALEKVKFPSVFVFVVRDGKIQCIWKQNMSPEMERQAIKEIRIRKSGYDDSEWTMLARELLLRPEFVNIVDPGRMLYK